MFRAVLLYFLIFASIELTAQFTVQDQPIQKIPDLSKTKEISFNLNGGLILMEAEQNGKKGQYILDTGAPCLILNKNNRDKKSNLQAVGVSGTMNIHEGKVNNFRLGKYIRQKIECLELDISHIEKLKKTKIAGLIGYDIIKGKELIFDYENNLLSMLDGEKTKSYKGHRRYKTVPFKMHGHIPILKIKIGNKKYKFGIDSGAEVNVLNYVDFKKMKSHQYHDTTESMVQSVGNEKIAVVSGELTSIEVGKETYLDLRFIFTDMNQFNNAYGTELDGLLGYTFLKERLHSIDFKNKELVIWE